MPSSDYTTAIPGGLKLKGAKDAGIKKKKKKSKSTPTTTTTTTTATKPSRSPEPALDADADADTDAGKGELQKALADEEDDVSAGEVVKKEVEVGRGGSVARVETGMGSSGKTEAQREAEERRRKRLDERLRKEGVKTHKERVEELNKYLAGLSEHHDMPRIGPG